MTLAKNIFVFLILNFSALAIGSLFTNDGVTSIWYQNLTKAPWTPPGWVFGATWTLIMICYSIYMALLINQNTDKMKIIILFFIQWILNISWNPIFFYYQNVALGLICISTLTVLIAYFLFNFGKTLKMKSILILPYLIWLLIATSLNGYILLHN